MRFGQDRRWATLVVAVALGAGGGSLLGFLTAPAGVVDAFPSLSPTQAAPSTTRRPRSRFAGVSATTRPSHRRYPPVTAGLRPSTTSTTSTLRPTTTTSTTTTTIDPTTSTTSTSTTTSLATTTS